MESTGRVGEESESETWKFSLMAKECERRRNWERRREISSKDGKTPRARVRGKACVSAILSLLCPKRKFSSGPRATAFRGRMRGKNFAHTSQTFEGENREKPLLESEERMRARPAVLGLSASALIATHLIA